MVYLDVAKNRGKLKSKEDEGDTGRKITYPQPYWG
jgi:hypothetical protein